MNWPRKPVGITLVKPEVMVAQGILTEADRRLQEAIAQRLKVEAVTQNLAAMRRRNHFAEMIRSIIRGGES